MDIKTYRSLLTPEELEEAKEVLALLEAAEPLDFYKDFMPFGFVFTN